ncbi:hypothetical protein SAMN05192534_101394 [Alteribacillus persepolensis]|uniref:Uncharacterized protein n=2 Tax=Alteribacillus persepolensis TaxID=568899 RepID=A0A1G7Z4C1_9BACI|nr:hypothetical protein SAMN05192534_101394 [Alteribacillus persepolensis]
MAVNIIFGFLFPWLFGMFFWKKDKRMVRKVVPFVSILSLIINTTGNKYWLVTPKLKKQQYLTTFPQNFGYFPMIGCLFIYTLYKKQTHTLFWTIVFAVVSSAVEFSAILFGKVKYRNGWTIIRTFFVYMCSLWLLHCYYTFFAKTKA